MSNINCVMISALWHLSVNGILRSKYTFILKLDVLEEEWSEINYHV